MGESNRAMFELPIPRLEEHVEVRERIDVVGRPRGEDEVARAPGVQSALRSAAPVEWLDLDVEPDLRQVPPDDPGVHQRLRKVERVEHCLAASRVPACERTCPAKVGTSSG